MKKQSIDFVVPWVDGSDPLWQSEKRKYLYGEGADVDGRDSRYRDWGLLKYWFRGVEKFAPWVRRIYFVTDGQLPEWLDVSAPGLIHVRHTDYLPQTYLPTFNSNTIEINLHRIKDLSEYFVYFNDDMFLLQPVRPEFFFRNGLPVLPNELQPIAARPGSIGMANMYLNDMRVINDRFMMGDIVRNRKNWFSPRTHSGKTLFKNAVFSGFEYCVGFKNPHFAVPIRKSTMNLMWEKEPEVLDATSKRRFRDARDVNQYLFRYWQYATNQFVPEKEIKMGKYYEIRDDNRRICRAIRKTRYPQICLNDMDLVSSDEALQRAKEDLAAAFRIILPDRSRFEKE